MVPEKSLIMTHVLVNKFQAAVWLTEEVGSEAPSKIFVGVFTPIKIEQRSSTLLQVHDVEMDGLLNQPEPQHSAIGKNICISYKITSTYDATKTLAALLAFLTNLTDWQPGRSPH